MGSALSDFVKGKELSVDNDQMAKALSETAHESTTGSGAGVTFLNFSGKTGAYSLGRDKEDIDPEHMYLVEPMTVFRGWQCWKQSKPIDKHKWSVFSNAAEVHEHDLEDHGPYREKMGEGWKQMLGFGCIPTHDTDLQIEFSTDSVSGRNVVSSLLDEIAQRARAGEACIPVIHFDKEQFEAQGQKNWKPKMDVEAWVTREAVSAFMREDIPYDEEDLIAGKKLTAAQKKKLQKQAEAA